MSDEYSWDCYRETLFEKEIEYIESHPEFCKEKNLIPYDIKEYLRLRVNEIKNKYKD